MGGKKLLRSKGRTIKKLQKLLRRKGRTIKKVQKHRRRGRRNQKGGGGLLPMLILGPLLAPVLEKTLGSIIKKI